MKACVIFTNFWDANILAKEKYFLYKPSSFEEERKMYLVLLKKFHFFSIALSIPKSKSISNISENIARLDFFCPTYTSLSHYKSSNDWQVYTKEYKNILRKNKEDISNWLDSLSQDTTYILCCWENTINGANCHRKLLFDILRNTSIWKEKANWIYRHGSGKDFKLLSDYNANEISNDQMLDYISLSTETSGYLDESSFNLVPSFTIDTSIASMASIINLSTTKVISP